MAAKFLFGFAPSISGTLGPLATNEIQLVWGVDGEIQKLRNTVSTIEDVLLDAEEKHAAGNRTVTGWLQRLEDAMFYADDLLDAVSTEALRRQIMTREKAKKVRICFFKSNQLVYRVKMAHKIKAIRESLDAIADDRLKLNFEVRRVEETRVGGNSDRGNTYVSVHKEVFGREDVKKAFINQLLDSNIAENVSIHPIVGFGGLGKTTFAKLIFNDKQIEEKHFDPKIWVCVSDPFNVKDVVVKILEVATGEKPEADQMATLVRKLENEINGKKYFLVLDDVWNEDFLELSKLKEVLMGGASGSIILVTTRSEIVAKNIGTVPSYSLRRLDEHASWSLFKHQVFKNGIVPKQNSSIVAIGKEIVAECLGVPLAIMTIGSLLRDKKLEEWSSFKKNELLKVTHNEKGIIPTLKISYDHLPSHLKHCFAYCSLYPKDYSFYVPTLIKLWIAQGFVKLSGQNQCLEDVGNDYFLYLLSRSFFQEAETDEFDIVFRCKMHDLMHELAESVAGSMITTLDAKERNVGEKTRHVSVVGSDIDALSITTSLRKARRVRTLLFSSIADNLWGELDCKAIFSSSKFLRVLVLYKRNCDFLPSSIGKLKHLRFLDLSYNLHLKKLPNSITGLQNLKTLILLNCRKLEELPRDIRKLVNLRHLEIDGCISLTYMPRGLGQLTNLKTLSDFVVDKDPLSRYSNGLGELNKLNNLGGMLRIQNLGHVKDVASEGKAANLKDKEYLHGLHLQWKDEGGLIDVKVNVDDEVLLEGLEPHPNLKHLFIHGSFCSKLPGWFLSLTNLVSFQLEFCVTCQYLPKLSALCFLKYLCLQDLSLLEYISDSNESTSSSSASVQFFPCLTEIFFRRCGKFKGWRWTRDSSVEVNSDTTNSVEITEYPLPPSFLCLSSLTILDCPMLTSMPLFPHLENLFLMYVSWENVQETMMHMAAPQSPTLTTTASSSSTPLSKLKSIQLEFIEDLKTLPKELLKNLTSLEFLRIGNCERLNSLSPGIQHLTALQHLELGKCPELELANDEDGMQWQGLKSLLSLELMDLPKMVSLPLGLQHATTLQELKIWTCGNLTAIPEWMYNCTSLYELEIVGCSSLTSLQQTMMMNMTTAQSPTSTAMASSSSTPLSKLLEIVGCSSLTSLHQTMMMNMTTAQSPTSTAMASSSSTPLSKLKSITLQTNADLETLPKELLKNLTSLESLRIEDCNRLNSLSPGIQHLIALQHLYLDNCPELELANDEDGMQWQGLKSLLSLEFRNLLKLVSLPLGLQHVTTLQMLKIWNCDNLTAIPEWIGNCTSLQVLGIDGCSSLTSLPEGMLSLTSLQRLKIRNNPVLLQRCEREVGEDWHKIARIRELELEKDVSSTYSEVGEPAKSQKKQRIWSIFKKSRALNS